MVKVIFISFVFASGVFAQTLPGIRDELLQMESRDQAARDTCAHGTVDEQAKCGQKIADEIDRPNTQRLNEIFAAYGFPTAKLVGVDGVKAFILLMQHSGDVPLRKKSEPGMKRAYESKVISPMEYAGFIDRLRVHEGKLQIYGSNFEAKDGKLVMSPVRDPKRLDARRKAMALMPIAEYATKLGEIYKLDVVIPPGH